MDASVDIRIDGLEIYAYHGVMDEEKVLGQPFLVDVLVELEACPGCLSDDVSGTADYTEMIDAITDRVTERSYDLLERLAYVIGTDLVERFPVRRAVVEVTKPRPPIPCSLESVGVRVEVAGRGS